MKYSKSSLLQNTVVINIRGKNINRFLKRLVSHKIDLLDIKQISYKEMNITVRADNYEKIKEIKTVYDMFLVDVHGGLKIKKIVRTNVHLISSFILGIILLIFLSNIIFDIEVIHTNSSVRNFLLDELKDEGISKLRLQKNYQSIEKIKKKIVSKHKDKIEWLEIERVGTKYIVRVEERKLSTPPSVISKRHIVASKSAIIKKIDAKTGEIVKNINDYVKPGDVVISGEIKLHDEIKDVLGAEGEVYGEVWYQTKITYPLTRRTEKVLNNYKHGLVIEIFGHRIELFNSFKHKEILKNYSIKNLLLPISISLEKQQEIEILEEMNTIDEAIDKALNKGKEKIEDRLDEDEYIISQNSLKVNVKSSKIELDVFYVVYENITSYQPIIEKPLEE
ncbi:MAG: sporulation protein YqfD [Bacilli bacterium]|nr:sporulation protein YqfD [Bacilli bacterium]